MKKTLLSIALMSASLAASAVELHGSLSGMSNAGYATGNYSEGVLLNPSLAAAYNPDKDDFALLLSAGALVSDQDDFIDRADELVDLIDEIDAASELTLADAEELKTRLLDIDGDNAAVNIGANLVVAIPNDIASLALIVNSRGSVALTPNLAESDIALIDAAIGGDFDPTDPIGGLKSTISGKGAIVTDLGVAFAKAYQLNNGNHLLVGVTPKKTEVESIIYSSNVGDFDEDDFDAEDYTRTESATNVDLGVTYLSGNYRYALVANNLQENTFKTVDPLETVTIERQLISSVGYVNGLFKAEAAVDLNSVAALGRSGETQLLRAGLEYSAWDWLRVRAGFQQDMKNTVEDSYSLGLGVGAFNLAYITGSENTEGFALSGGVRF